VSAKPAETLKANGHEVSQLSTRWRQVGYHDAQRLADSKEQAKEWAKTGHVPVQIWSVRLEGGKNPQPVSGPECGHTGHLPKPKATPKQRESSEAIKARDKQIVSGFKAGLTRGELAAKHGISSMRVCQIIKGGTEVSSV
jgi:DNA-directed RNA polymerase specialized sigma subunit